MPASSLGGRIPTSNVGSVATGRQGNIQFQIAQSVRPDLIEHHFADAVTQTMRSGRFLLLIAGDGIREDVGALAELINRNAAAGFSFGLVEVALYDLGSEDELAIQPRVVAKSQIIERTVVLLREGGLQLGPADDGNGSNEIPDRGTSEPVRLAEGGNTESTSQAAYRRWWQPLLDMTFDDPDQGPPRLYYPNNVRAQLPWPGTWVTAYGGTDHYGVFLGGREGALAELWEEIVAELPPGTEEGVRWDGSKGILTKRSIDTFAGHDEAREWLKRTMNAYVNVLRPRMKHFVESH